MRRARRGHHEPHGCRGRGAQARARHPAPPLPSPTARCSRRRCAPTPRPASSIARGAPRAPAHHRLLLGRRVAVEHPVPTRRGAFAAYLVDAETGKLYEGGLSNGQRENDLEIARVNIAGELLDLEAGGRVADELDPVRISTASSMRTATSGRSSPARVLRRAERWRINERVNRLNDLGFDIEELAIRTDETGTTAHPAEGRRRRAPPAAAAAPHRPGRRREPGRRLLNDLDSYRAAYNKQDLDEEMVAHEWLMRVFEPVVRAVPQDLRGKLEPAEVFHELLEHRWFMAQQQGRDIPLAEALTAYINDVLRHRDEATVIGPPTGDHTTALDVVAPDTAAIPCTTPTTRATGASRSERPASPTWVSGASARRALELRDLVEGDGCRDARVERLGRRRDRDRDDRVAGLGDQAREPLPSLPTTMTIGRSARSRGRQRHVAAAVEPSTNTPRSLSAFSVCVRFGAIATGTRAAPADVFHAAAVTPTERRCGRSRPGRRTRRSSG